MCGPYIRVHSGMTYDGSDPNIIPATISSRTVSCIKQLVTLFYDEYIAMQYFTAVYKIIKGTVTCFKL